jgi:hypothetical protein
MDRVSSVLAHNKCTNTLPNIETTTQMVIITTTTKTTKVMGNTKTARLTTNLLLVPKFGHQKVLKRPNEDQMLFR